MTPAMGLILLGVILMGWGIRLCVEVFTQMLWLLIRVCNEPHKENISYSFSALAIMIACGFPPFGLALILIGIKWLPT